MPSPRETRAWAVVDEKGGIVVATATGQALVFETWDLALREKFGPSERVIEVRIVPVEEEE